MNAPISLANLPIGVGAVVESLPTGRSALTRLRELGLVPGTRVTVLRRAPLGEPIEIFLRGSHVAMRNHEAAKIRVTEVGG